MSCDFDSLWIVGNSQFIRDTIKDEDNAADSGLTVVAYVLAAIDDDIGDALASQALTEVGATGVYEGTIASDDLSGALTAATEYWVVTADAANGYRSPPKKIHYGYFDPSLSPA